MAVTGIDPFQNYTIGLAYDSISAVAEKNIKEWFEVAKDIPQDEPGVLGYVIAIRVLAEYQPKQVTLRTNDVRRWKEQYEQWLEKFGKKIKVKRGVDRDKMNENALKEFDLLIEALDGT